MKPKIPAKTVIAELADPLTLYKVIDDWYEDSIKFDGKPGSELWVTLLITDLVNEISDRWSGKTGYSSKLFPWKNEFVALLATKKSNKFILPTKRKR